MFSTSLAVAAMSGLLMSGSVPTTPNWQTDYRTALRLSAEQNKPLVVIIHSGGAQKLFQEAAGPKEALPVVRQSYVGLSVDPQTPEGKQIADLFRMEQGLVISDKGGAVQALRYEGTLAAPEVKGYLTRYASTTQAPASTEYAYQPGYVPTVTYQSYPTVTPSQPGILNPNGPINNFVVRPVANVFNATRSVIGGS